MTANKPKVAIYRFKDSPDDMRSRWCYTRLASHVPKGHHGEALIRLADYQRLQAETERLQAECEKLRKDAERYRWLRRHATLDGGSDYHFPEVHAWEYKEGAEPNEQYGSLDSAIDAAMEGCANDNQ